VVPLRNPPALGQRPEDFAERVSGRGEQTGNVLEKEPPGACLADDAPDFTPEPSLVVDARSSPGDAVALARDSRNDEIHASAPRSAVEGREIVGHRSAIHGTFRHSSNDDGCGVGLPLDNTHKTKGWQNHPDSHVESEDSAAEGEAGSGIFGTWSHIHARSEIDSATCST
jgi:hypothetical protein